MSKKIPDELRLTTKSKRPSISLAGRLANLHLLLRAPAFARWPLTLRFFSEEVHRVWTAYCAKTTALPTGLKVVFDPRIADSEDEGSVSADENEPPPSSQLAVEKKKKKRKSKSKWAASGKGGVQALDITDDRLEIYVRKTRAVLEEAGATTPTGGAQCHICNQHCVAEQAVVCLHAFCEHTSHLTCLSELFLDQEHRQGTSDVLQVLPVQGSCPECGKISSWGDIVKTLSMRTRTKEKGSRSKAPATSTVTATKTTRGRRKQQTPISESDDSDVDILEPEISAMDIADIPEEQKAELSMLDLEESSSESDIWLLPSQEEEKPVVRTRKKPNSKAVEKESKITGASKARKKRVPKVLELQDEA